MKHFFWAGVTVLVCSQFIIGCKKDKQSESGPGAIQNNFLPNAGSYTYHITATDGSTGDETVTVSAKRDSTSGGHAVTMTSIAAGSHLTSVLYADATNTIEPIYPPKEFDSLANFIRSQPGISQFTYEGWPVYQKFPNTANLNDPFSFSGGPVHLHFSTVSGVLDYTIQYLNGKVVQTGQKITTPAGSYTCSVWAYTIKTTAVLPTGTVVNNFSDTLWMAPGVPFIKSSEQSPTAYSVTMLTRISQ